VLNAISIGVETQQRLEGDVSPYLRVIELVCLGFFLTELALRLLVNGCKHWCGPWLCFDACLIFFGLLSQVVLEPLKESGDVSEETQQNTAMVLLLRLFRLMRVVRALRFLAIFSDMWKMCNGLMKSATTMLSVLALFGTVVYVFACLGLDLISQSSLAEDEMTKDIVAVKFSSLPTAMLTLLQFSNADSTAVVYAPLIQAQPLLAFYFGALWLILSVALMNVITAVILESALAKSKEEAQDQVLHKRNMFQKVRPQLVELFEELDADNNGYISLEEIQFAILGGKLTLPKEIALCLAPEQIIDTFDFLDADRDGQITSKEFVEGVLVLVLSSVSLETAQLLHLTRMSYSLMAQTSYSVKKIEDELSQAGGKL
jgi:voltage-gated sodium channel